jgi:hypothetical protein
MRAKLDPSRPTRHDPATSAADADPAVRIDIVVRNDVARDVLITINGIPIIGGVDDEP